jgi:S-adenosylmethionine hydrolase
MGSLGRAAPPFISFLTDFGADNAPAVCRGVMWGIVPDARICDVTHAIAKFDVRGGAFRLACAVPYFPIGVHLAVVDPGVGTARRPIAILTGRGDILVGPDNGLLRPAAERLGGAREARQLENPALWRDHVSDTFHARDVFAPVAAHLAGGTRFDELGAAVPTASLVELVLPSASVRDGGLDSGVLLVDSFGNCRLAGEPVDLERATGALDPGRRFRVAMPSAVIEAPWVRTFADVTPGQPLLYDDADYAGLALAVNRGSAAERFELMVDDRVRIEPA